MYFMDGFRVLNVHLSSSKRTYWGFGVFVYVKTVLQKVEDTFSFPWAYIYS
jgi:hypothetical protein